MIEKRTQQRLLRPGSPQRLANGSGQVLHVVWNKVSHVGIFSPVPDLLIGVKFGGIRRKPFDGQSSFKTLRQLSSRAAVYHPSVPDQNNTFGEVNQQGSHERLSIVCDNIVVEQVEIQSQSAALRRGGNGRDNRQPISAIPTVLNWRLASRHPGTADDGLEHKTTFVNENDGFTAFSGVFLSAASRSFAMQQWPVRCVRGLVVRASGNSSPSVPAHARLWMDRSTTTPF